MNVVASDMHARILRGFLTFKRRLLRRLKKDDRSGKIMSGLTDISRRYLNEENQATTRYPTRVIQLLNKRQFLRPRDLDEFNISRVYLNKLYVEGVLERPSRGLYVLPDSQPSEMRTIVEACKLVPKGIVCLLTALRIHELTTESPFEVWMAIGEKDRKPKIDYPRNQ